MVDLLSAVIGMSVGICIGIIGGVLWTGSVIDDLRDENERLSQRLTRLTTRGPGGRFVKTNK